MIYLINCIVIYFFKILSVFGRGFYLKKKCFSSKNILEINFQKNEKFNFIQVGANDGVSFDFLFDFIVLRDSQGIVIEPVKDYFSELVANYGNFNKIIKINKAVHPFLNRVVINKISPLAIEKYPDWVKGIASLDPEHHKKTFIDSKHILKEEVDADHLMNIINQHLSNKNLDYLQVDTEGFDYEIIKMIDFNIIKPSIIKYESVNLEIEEQKKLIILLRNKGYLTFNEYGDTIGINLKKVKLL
ncbi:FkbM family methyltransferase [Flavobacterium myungsuense]|uniref:FkbM family methyltransferase n=1 Tax=Flavobacterium myungsuense TaxID=651823 RepID=A0ABW3IZG9_9FLAO